MASGLAALDAPAHAHQAGGEPSHHVEAIKHVGGVSQMDADGGPVGLGSVGDHQLHAATPPMAPFGEKA